jgi:hypothetical protein
LLGYKASKFILDNFSVSTYTRRMEEVYSEVPGVRTRRQPSVRPAARAQT